MTQNGVELTEAEKLAKAYFMRTMSSWKELCKEEPSSIPDSTPAWYNDDLYKKGQKFFKENRPGILYMNYLGLLIFLASPRGIEIFNFIERFQTPNGGNRNRNISILLHVLSWYKYDLSPGSKAIKSLRKAGRIHRLVSKTLHSRGRPSILQSDLSSTAFGFMGLFLARPDLFPVRTKNEEELKGFVHFWAVICHMIGIKDDYNFCLLPIDAVIVYCQMMFRYIFLPLIQIRNWEYERMLRAVTVEMKPHIIEVDFDMDLFAIKRLLLVPGYQFNVNHKTEILCRSILNQDDVDKLNTVERDHYYSVDIPIFEITKDPGRNISIEEAFHLQIPILTRMDLKPGESVKVRMVNYETEWQTCLNSSKYNELPLTTKMAIIQKDMLNGLCSNFAGRFLADKVLSLAIVGMKKASKKFKNSLREADFIS